MKNETVGMGKRGIGTCGDVVYKESWKKTYVCRMPKDKRIEYRVTWDFYDELEHYRMRESMTMTQAITALVRRGLDSLKVVVQSKRLEESVVINERERVVELDNGQRIVKNEYVDE